MERHIEVGGILYTKDEYEKITARAKRVKLKREALKFYESGHTQKETAERFGITVRTLYNWLKEGDEHEL